MNYSYSYNYGGDYDAATGALSGAIGGILVVICFMAVIISIACLVLEYVGYWKIFKKLGMEGWKSLIPFYNNYCIANALDGQELAIVYTAFPAATALCSMIAPQIAIAGSLGTFIVGIVVMNKLRKRFDKGVGYTWGLVLVPFIFLPILGIGKAMPISKAAAKAKDKPATPAAEPIDVEPISVSTTAPQQTAETPADTRSAEEIAHEEQMAKLRAIQTKRESNDPSIERID